MEPSNINIIGNGGSPNQAHLTKEGLVPQWEDGTKIIIPKESLSINEEGMVSIPSEIPFVILQEPGAAPLVLNWNSAFLGLISTGGESDDSEDEVPAGDWTEIGVLAELLNWHVSLGDPSSLPFASLDLPNPAEFAELKQIAGDDINIEEDINIDSRIPQIGNAEIRIFEEGLPGGIPDGVGYGDLIGGVIAFVQVNVNDPDGDPLSFAINALTHDLSSGGVPIVWSGDGSHTLTGQAGDSVIFKVQISDDGLVTVIQKGPLDHPDPTGEDELPFQIEVVVSDGTYSVSGIITIAVEDDSPVIIPGHVQIDEHIESVLILDEQEQVQETDGGAGTGQEESVNSVSGSLAIEFGADGPATDELTVALTAVETSEPDLGSVALTSGGLAVTTVWDPATNILTGSTTDGSVFDLQVNADTGSYEFTLHAALDHPSNDADGNNDGPELSYEDNLVLNFTATIRDFDGDEASTVFTVTVNDDIPADSFVNEEIATDTLTLDESPDGEETDGNSDPAGLASVTVSFADNFATPDYGADGPGSTVYSLVLNGSNVRSGLSPSNLIEDLIAGGRYNVIYGTNGSDVLIGTAGNDIILGGDGHDRIYGGSGNDIIFGGDGDDIIFGGDGDDVIFGGDGDDVIFGGEENDIIIGDSGNDHLFGGNGNDIILDGGGNDIISEGGSPEILLNQDGDTITGSLGPVIYFTIDIDPGTGEVTFTQFESISHGDTDNDDDTAALMTALASDLQVVQTITDGDGDQSDSASIDLGNGVFQIEDDGPTATVNSEAAQDTLVISESDASNTANSNFADNFATETNFGTDGEGSVAYRLDLNSNGVGSGLYALDSSDTAASDGDGIGQGGEILLHQTGNTITGTVTQPGENGRPGTAIDYFTIAINPNTGDVTFTQLKNIWHDDTASSEEVATLTTSLASDVQVVQIVTDADGDSDEAAIDVGAGVFRIGDDGPNASAKNSPPDTITVDESNLGGASDQSASATFSDNFNGPDFGSDGEGNTVYNLHLGGENVGSGLYALDPTDTNADPGSDGYDGDGIGQGAEILLNQSGNTITGSAGGTNYFTIEVDSDTGEVTFDQLENIWHGGSGNVNDVATLTTSMASAIQLVQTVTDSDGDSATASINLGNNVFRIADDGPSATVNSSAADTLVITASSGPAQASFADNIDSSYGTDGPGSSVYGLTTEGRIGSGLFADNGGAKGAEITLDQNGNLITGAVTTGYPDSDAGYSRVDYFTISIDPGTGIVTFAQLASVWHDSGTTSTLMTGTASGIRVTHSITDTDNDTATVAINVGQGVFSIEAGASQALPVVLDLDGDGLEFAALSEVAIFDMDSDGTLDYSAWVGADDALLAYDHNENGIVDNGTEIAFAQYAEGAETDLEGLSMAFDSNGDGVLSADDSDFEYFGIWQDANSNGLTDEGEFQNLAEAGIEAINLNSDGVSYETANGDVTVFGEGTYLNSDGSEGTLGDVAFATRDGEVPELSDLFSDAGETMDGLLETFAESDDGTENASSGTDQGPAETAPLEAPPLLEAPLDAPTAV